MRKKKEDHWFSLKTVNPNLGSSIQVDNSADPLVGIFLASMNTTDLFFISILIKLSYQNVNRTTSIWSKYLYTCDKTLLFDFHHKWATSLENLLSDVCDLVRLKSVSSATEAS